MKGMQNTTSLSKPVPASRDIPGKGATMAPKKIPSTGVRGGKVPGGTKR